MQWVSCASSRLTVWLQGLKVRDLSSTPVSRAILETSCSGIRLQTWRKRLNRQRVGLIVFLFFIPAVWQVQNVKPTLFFIFCGMALKYLGKTVPAAMNCHSQNTGVQLHDNDQRSVI